MHLKYNQTVKPFLLGNMRQHQFRLGILLEATTQQQCDCDPLIRDDEGYIAPGLQKSAKSSFTCPWFDPAKFIIHVNV